MLILVTGGAGFIGSHVVRKLRAEGHKVRVLDSCVHGGDQVESLDTAEALGDVRDPSAVSEAAYGVDFIVHLASIAGVGSVGRDPVRTMDVIQTGTRNVLNAALAEAAGVLNFSSSEVYGTHAACVKETDPTPLPPPTHTRWGYGAAKLAAEHLCRAYYEHHGVPVCSFRIFNTYGPGQLGDGAVHNFVRAALAGEAFAIRGDGAAVRTWCHVSETVRAVQAVIERMDRTKLRPLGGQVFNIGNPYELASTMMLADSVSRACGQKFAIREPMPGVADVRVRIPDISKAAELLEWEPIVPLAVGLEDTVDYYRALQGLKDA